MYLYFFLSILYVFLLSINKILTAKNKQVHLQLDIADV